MTRSENKNITCFDQYAREYENWFEAHKADYEDELQTLQYLIGDAQNGLEIGMGTGRFAIRPHIVIGIEPSKSMRDIALSKGLNILEGIAENLPFEDEKFDFIVMMTTVCFVQNIEKALEEAFRVLKYKGFLLIGYIDANSKLGKKVVLHKDESKFYAHAKFYSAFEMTQFLKNVGFSASADDRFLESNSGISFIKIYK